MKPACARVIDAVREVSSRVVALRKTLPRGEPRAILKEAKFWLRVADLKASTGACQKGRYDLVHAKNKVRAAIIVARRNTR